MLRLPAGEQLGGQRGHRAPSNFRTQAPLHLPALPVRLLVPSSHCTRIGARAFVRDDDGATSAIGASRSSTHLNSGTTSGFANSSQRTHDISNGISSAAMTGAVVFETTTLSFINPHGERLAAKFVDTGSDDVIILCHGYASTKDGFHLPRLAAELASPRGGGKSSLRFDFAGNGESEGAFSFGSYFREVEDLRAAVLFVRDTLKRNVHAIVGHSKGGNVVLLYASRYDDVPYVVNIAGRGVMSRGIKERFGADIFKRLDLEGAVEQEVRADGGRRIIKYLLTKESVDERMKLDMLSEASKIARAQVLTVHGSSDSVIPVADAHELGSRICRHTLCIVEGADHNFRAPPDGAADQLVRLVTEFLGQM